MDFEEHEGRRVCSDCGCSFDQLYDDGPERRNFFGGPDHSTTFHVDPYVGITTSSTRIGRGENPLQKVQQRLVPTETKKQGKLEKSFGELKQVATVLGTRECVVNTAKYLMSKFLDRVDRVEGDEQANKKGQKKARTRINGTSSSEFSVAFIWVASNYHHNGTPFADLLNHIPDVNKKKVRKFLGEIERLIGENVNQVAPNPKNYVEQIGFKFELPYPVTGKAMSIVDQVLSHQCSKGCGKTMTGMRPSTLAAACFWKASCLLQQDYGYDLLKEEDVAICAGIETGTLTQAINNLDSHRSAMKIN